MISFLLAGDNLPFTIAIVLMVAIGALELIFTLFGPGLSSLLEAGLPDLSPDANLDATGFEEVTPLSKVLGWLRVGQVPLLILFVVFLTAFGVIGLAGQYIARMFMGFLIPAPLAAVGAFAAAFPACASSVESWEKSSRVTKPRRSRRRPSWAASRHSPRASARAGRPAEARLQDQFRQAHYILVEPDNETDVFEPGAAVLIVRRQGSHFIAIRNPNSALVD